MRTIEGHFGHAGEVLSVPASVLARVGLGDYWTDLY